MNALTDETPDTDDWQSDIDALRIELSQRLATMQGAPRHCPERMCRRARRCMVKAMPCARRVRQPQVSQEEERRRIAEFYRMLRSRVDALEAEEEEAERVAAPVSPRGRTRRAEKDAARSSR